MRLLVLYQAHDAAKDQPGYYDGFQRLVCEGTLSAHVAIPYYGIAEQHGWDAVWRSAYNAAQETGADAVFLQFFHGAIPDPSKGINRLKALPTQPSVFVSLGDPFGRWTKRVPHCFRVASRLADVSFLTGMGYLARQLSRWGSKNIVLMPHGCCQVRFALPLCPGNYNPEFDVVFIGSHIVGHNPFGHFFWVGRRRESFVVAMTKRYGPRFGLFGRSWEGYVSWQGPIPYDQQYVAMRRSAVVVGGLPNAYHDYYTSDRVFIALASGVPFVDYWVPGVDRLLEPGRDWWLATDTRGMINWCDRLLEMSSSNRLELGEHTRQRVLMFHTQYHRCREMIEIVCSLRAARRTGKVANRPILGFLANTRREQGRPASIVNWQG
jgi:hypothetical protein